MSKDETKMSQMSMKHSFDFWHELFNTLNKPIQWVAFIYFFLVSFTHLHTPSYNGGRGLHVRHHLLSGNQSH